MRLCALAVLLSLSLSMPAGFAQNPETLPDIDVLYIERTPRYPGYRPGFLLRASAPARHVPAGQAESTAAPGPALDQPLAVENVRPRDVPVSGLFFTGSRTSLTCTASAPGLPCVARRAIFRQCSARDQP